jgi:hypothetical protein
MSVRISFPSSVRSAVLVALRDPFSTWAVAVSPGLRPWVDTDSLSSFLGMLIFWPVRIRLGSLRPFSAATRSIRVFPVFVFGIRFFEAVAVVQQHVLNAVVLTFFPAISLDFGSAWVSRLDLNLVFYSSS